MNGDTELEREARAIAQKDRERAEGLEMLLKHPAWPLYVELLEAALERRGALLMEPLPANELNAVERSEHNKGAMYGIAFAKDLPRVTVAMAQEQRKSEPASEDDDE